MDVRPVNVVSTSGEPSKSSAYAAFPHGLRNTPIVICDEYANVRQNLVGLHGI